MNTRIAGVEPVGGGCINQTFRATLDDGTTVFVKSNSSSPAGLFEAEAHGLSWLTVNEGLRVPSVVSYSDDQPGFLVLEDLGTGPPTPMYQATLGRGLATLHRSGAPQFGLTRSNYLANLVQDNTPTDTWSEFLVARRLRPQLRLAIDSNRAPSNWKAKFESIFSRIRELVGPPEPPARLHGDLWSGNVHCDASGNPSLVDPAVYGGHREVDLAMLGLFGTLSSEFLDAYSEVHPLVDGHEERRPLNQLYPLLTHVVLFGGSYVAQTEGVLKKLV